MSEPNKRSMMGNRGPVGGEKAAPARKGLGRGLGAIFSESATVAAQNGNQETAGGLKKLPIGQVKPNANQPRRHFDDDALNDLASSIKEKGILEPILVRPLGRDFQIVAGERRWRAAQLAQLHEVPVIVRDFDDRTTLEIALIENIQREDLTPIEEATGYKQLMDEFSHTQDALSKVVGRSRSHVANMLRLLQLPEKVQDMVNDGQLSAGHARAVLSTDVPEETARKVADEGLSVRQTEKLVQQMKSGEQPVGGDDALTSQKVKKTSSNQATSESTSGISANKDADIVALEDSLRQALGMAVTLNSKSDGSGNLVISWSDLDQLDEICRLLQAS